MAQVERVERAQNTMKNGSTHSPSLLSSLARTWRGKNTPKSHSGQQIIKKGGQKVFAELTILG